MYIYIGRYYNIIKSDILIFSFKLTLPFLDFMNYPTYNYQIYINGILNLYLLEIRTHVFGFWEIRFAWFANTRFSLFASFACGFSVVRAYG